MPKPNFIAKCLLALGLATHLILALGAARIETPYRR